MGSCCCCHRHRHDGCHFFHLTSCPAGETISESYITEYSTDKIEMHTGAVQPGQKVVLVSVPVSRPVNQFSKGSQLSCSCRAHTQHCGAATVH